MSRSAALYETDFFEWTRHQAETLRDAGPRLGNVADLDVEHLAEEIEDMGKRDLREAETRFERILEHALKLEYSPATQPRAGWRTTIREQRSQLERVLRDSPSLRRRIDLTQIYQSARELAAEALSQDDVDPGALPQSSPYSLEQIMSGEELLRG